MTNTSKIPKELKISRLTKGELMILLRNEFNREELATLYYYAISNKQCEFKKEQLLNELEAEAMEVSDGWIVMDDKKQFPLYN